MSDETQPRVVPIRRGAVPEPLVEAFPDLAASTDDEAGWEDTFPAAQAVTGLFNEGSALASYGFFQWLQGQASVGEVIEPLRERAAEIFCAIDELERRMMSGDDGTDDPDGGLPKAGGL